MLSKQGYICCNIAEATLLVVVLLKQYNCSYNVADSKCSGLKIIESMSFVSENCHSNTVLLEYHWGKVLLHNFVLVICPPMVLLNQTQRYSCGCYLVKGSLSNVSLPQSIVEIVLFVKWYVSLVLSDYKWCCDTKSYIIVLVYWVLKLRPKTASE